MNSGPFYSEDRERRCPRCGHKQSVEMCDLGVREGTVKVSCEECDHRYEILIELIPSIMSPPRE